MTKPRKSVFESIGSEKIRAIISSFYDLALKDIIIGHFFFGKNHDTLVQRQFEFTCRMLGSDKIAYHGKNIKVAHQPFRIGEVHYLRRHVLLKQAMHKHELPSHLQTAWLQKENTLKPQIVPSKTPKFK